MTSPLLQRFLDSMTITFDMWHDGLGYDLDALREMGPSDGLEVENLLIGRLCTEADWRDVEALYVLATPRSRQSVLDARQHRQIEVRNCALRYSALLEPEPPDEDKAVESAIIESIQAAGAMANLASTLDLAGQHPTPGVLLALLERCRTGDATTRVNCAALLLYLRGEAAEPFDWAQRPFFLRFHTEDAAELAAVWNELRERARL